jgi:hypothetical protein
LPSPGGPTCFTLNNPCAKAAFAFLVFAAQGLYRCNQAQQQRGYFNEAFFTVCYYTHFFILN